MTQNIEHGHYVRNVDTGDQVEVAHCVHGWVIPWHDENGAYDLTPAEARAIGGLLVAAADKADELNSNPLLPRVPVSPFANGAIVLKGEPASFPRLAGEVTK